MYVDVHSHLTHKDFSEDLPEVIARAQSAGLKAVVVNGLEPKSNRRILELVESYPLLQPALGIYPLDAVNEQIDELPFPVPQFDVMEEANFIEAQAKAGRLLAIGECGLDGYWVKEATFPGQEKVFIRLIEIAMSTDLPLIIHTRKREERAMEILAHYGVKRVDFHCYGGKVKAALRAAEQHGWYFSIPANAVHNEAFQKMLKQLPPTRILTETDCPYLSPQKGSRNEPAHVVGTVDLLAKLRGWSVDFALERVWQNYQDLFLASHPERKA